MPLENGPQRPGGPVGQAASLRQRGHGLRLTDMASKNMLVVVERLWVNELTDRTMSESERFVQIRSQVVVFAFLLSQAATRLVDRFIDDRNK